VGVSPLGAATALLGLVAGVGLAAQEPTGRVEIQVTLERDGSARVEERYLLAPTPPAVELRALTRPCAEIAGVRLERGGAVEALDPERDGPWLLYRLPPGTLAGDTLRATVRYGVTTTARDVSVPLLHLTEPIPQRDGEREGTVHVRVRSAEPGASIRFPHMARASDGGWEARYVAIPSFVEVARAQPPGDGGRDCATGEVPAAGGGGGDGGLTWRFLLFVGIMAAWVPTYLLWARRSGEDGA
jgi:hypothetical protein